jgi:small subunit ribosomal protein S6e
VLIISDPENGTSQRVELEDAMMAPLVGSRIGQVIDGTIAGLTGYKLMLTGGTDKDGIPMRPDVHGGAKARIVLSGGVGYKQKEKGERKRVVVRGNTVTADTTYLNLKIVEKPKAKKKKTEEPTPEEPPEEKEKEST